MTFCHTDFRKENELSFIPNLHSYESNQNSQQYSNLTKGGLTNTVDYPSSLKVFTLYGIVIINSTQGLPLPTVDLGVYLLNANIHMPMSNHHIDLDVILATNYGRYTSCPV